MTTLIEQAVVGTYAPQVRGGAPGLPRLPALLAAAVLIFAAAMKWKQLPVIAWVGAGLLHDPVVAAAQAALEAVLAVWLLSRLASWWSQRFTLASFGLFTAVAAYRSIVGEDSCGCFGEFKVNPWITLMLDLLMVGLLWWGIRVQKRMRIGNGQVQYGMRYTCVRVAVLVLAIIAAAALTWWRMPGVAAPVGGEGSGIVQAGGLMILEPEKWAGKAVPLWAYLKTEGEAAKNEDGPPMRNGVVVIYSNDCEHCRELVPGWAQRARDQGESWLFVETPPYAAEEEGMVRSGSGVSTARLTDSHEWFAATPVLALVENGVVVRAKESAHAEDVPGH